MDDEQYPPITPLLPRQPDEADLACCPTMLYWAFTGDDILVEFNPHLREWGIQGGGTVVFKHCPWCGVKLPNSLREVYYDELRALSEFGEDVPEWEDRPPEYTTSQRWRESGL